MCKDQVGTRNCTNGRKVIADTPTNIQFWSIGEHKTQQPRRIARSSSLERLDMTYRHLTPRSPDWIPEFEFRLPQSSPSFSLSQKSNPQASDPRYSPYSPSMGSLHQPLLQ